MKIEIVREGLPGGTLPEMRRMAEQIVDYAGIDLVTPDGSVSGWRNAVISSDRLKRQGKRPCRRPPSRQALALVQVELRYARRTRRTGSKQYQPL